MESILHDEKFYVGEARTIVFILHSSGLPLNFFVCVAGVSLFAEAECDECNRRYLRVLSSLFSSCLSPFSLFIFPFLFPFFFLHVMNSSSSPASSPEKGETVHYSLSLHGCVIV